MSKTTTRANIDALLEYDCGAAVADAPPEVRGPIEQAYRRGVEQGATYMLDVAENRPADTHAFLYALHLWRWKGYLRGYLVVQRPPGALSWFRTGHIAWSKNDRPEHIERGSR